MYMGNPSWRRAAAGVGPADDLLFLGHSVVRRNRQHRFGPAGAWDRSYHGADAGPGGVSKRWLGLQPRLDDVRR